MNRRFDEQTKDALTPSEIKKERSYRIEERISILCGANQPTDEQIALATKEADDWMNEAQMGQRTLMQAELL